MTFAPQTERPLFDLAETRGHLTGFWQGEARGDAVRRILVMLLFAALVVGFAGVLALGMWREAPGTNSYALLADAWLHGRLWVDRCFDLDCAYFNERMYVALPPMPAVIALPFVALFGPEFHAFVPLAVIALGLSALLWWRIGEKLTASRDLTALLLLVVLFATPLAFVTLRGDRIWFFAQSCGFLFTSAALYFALVSRNALVAGLFIGMAFLSRQMAILYGPLLYVLLLEPGKPLFRIDAAAVKRAVSLALFPAVAVAVYLAYNYVRFGSPTETGYSYLFLLPGQFDLGPDTKDFITARVREVGLFSRDYFLFNAIYMFLAGPHVEFVGRYLTELGGFDSNGASPFLIAPVLLVAFLARWDRGFWIGLATCALIGGLTLFYHSNGYSQYSAQRYVLDWLPILFIFMARGMKPAHTGLLSIFALYSMAVTLGMIAVGAVAAGA